MKMQCVYTMGFYSAAKENEICRKVGKSSKYYIKQFNSASQRQKSHVLFHIWILAYNGGPLTVTYKYCSPLDKTWLAAHWFSRNAFTTGNTVGLALEHYQPSANSRLKLLHSYRAHWLKRSPRTLEKESKQYINCVTGVALGEKRPQKQLISTNKGPQTSCLLSHGAPSTLRGVTVITIRGLWLFYHFPECHDCNLNGSNMAGLKVCQVL